MTYQQLSFLIVLRSDCLLRAITISSVSRLILEPEWRWVGLQVSISLGSVARRILINSARNVRRVLGINYCETRTLGGGRCDVGWEVSMGHSLYSQGRCVKGENRMMASSSGIYVCSFEIVGNLNPFNIHLTLTSINRFNPSSLERVTWLGSRNHWTQAEAETEHWLN